ncbi:MULTISPECIES: TAXI family TRAP transporter solute-binding subunit [unclassified Microbacterium]|uniref:TAXI family TRAP transporter solute-binding subunit n=1 Tax=unclassified Microbacterium TaxID=2609290 RepID=UPI0022F0BA1C|nr:TAXI family TRAP transporter solute-binding subunit [Streptomyces sp. MS2A]
MSTITTRLLGSAAALVVAGLALTACGGAQNRPSGGADESPETSASGTCEAPAQQLAIATGNSTGVYYVLGGAIADVLSSETPLRATAAETGASVQNIEQVVAGQYAMAFSLADTAADAVAGTGAFTEPQPIQTLGRTHSNYTQVVVRADSGIESLEDMAGKTVSTGSPKSGTEVIALRLLESAGLTPDTDVTTQRLDLATSVDGLRDGTIDALFWSGGLPTPNLTDLFTTNGDAVRFLDITPALPAMQKINPVYQEGEIPADTYRTDAAIPTIVVPNVLVVRDDMDDALACGITAAIWTHADEIAQVHPAGEELDPAWAVESDPIPLAPGAKQAFDELG